jgi:hypothetical protein
MEKWRRTLLGELVPDRDTANLEYYFTCGYAGKE